MSAVGSNWITVEWTAPGDDGTVGTTSSYDIRYASSPIVDQAGFEALYLSGASIAYTRLGRSDIGLTTYSEVEDVLAAEAVALMEARRINTLLVVDAAGVLVGAVSTNDLMRAKVI